MGLWSRMARDCDLFRHSPCQNRKNWFQHGLVGFHLPSRRFYDRNHATCHRIGLWSIPNLGHDFLVVRGRLMALYRDHDFHQSVQRCDVRLRRLDAYIC